MYKHTAFKWMVIFDFYKWSTPAFQWVIYLRSTPNDASSR
jgi:hypothetical protein